MSTVSTVLPDQILGIRYRFAKITNNVPDYYVQSQPSRRKQTQCQCPVRYIVKEHSRLPSVIRGKREFMMILLMLVQINKVGIVVKERQVNNRPL
jgi:hypothetical protein